MNAPGRKRRTVGLPETRQREWLLDIDFLMDGRGEPQLADVQRPVAYTDEHHGPPKRRASCGRMTSH